MYSLQNNCNKITAFFSYGLYLAIILLQNNKLIIKPNWLAEIVSIVPTQQKKAVEDLQLFGY